MALDLISLVTGSKRNQDVETAHAFYRTRVPAAGSEAYLHTIYKAAPPELVREISQELGFPDPVIELYGSCNGADLFFNALSVFGCVERGALLDRTDRFKLPPLDVRDINSRLKAKLSDRNLVAVGFYSYDGSYVCIERESGQAVCFAGKAVADERTRWKSIDDWLREEISRISFLFDESGRRLVGKEMLLPGSQPSPAS